MISVVAISEVSGPFFCSFSMLRRFFSKSLTKESHSIKLLLEMPSPIPKKFSIGFSLRSVLMRMRTM
ncbi:hypothetical protein QN277_019518 [Acacia crassicarpa]|uniref:Uncharacterized protein n=1 Tax=Acacia crassicarpa TaxID=499986 RepID=A0AAE1MMA7_9FABA|nr:hypothetical protein QN277_019518 [Acacia crassicarpa]